MEDRNKTSGTPRKCSQRKCKERTEASFVRRHNVLPSEIRRIAQNAIWWRHKQANINLQCNLEA